MKVTKVLVVCLLAVPACGGSTEDANGNGGTGGLGSGGTAGAAGGSGGAGAAGGSGGAGGAAGGGAGAGAGGAAGTGAAGAGGVAGGSGAAGAGAVAGAGGAGGAAGGAGVECGTAACGSGEVCLVCDPTGAQSPKTCTPPFQDSCQTFPNLQMFCDGHEDCAANERCMVVEGSVGTYLQCIEPNACMDTCSCGPGAFAWGCRTLADCPPCATSCEPYQQWEQGAAFPVDVCRW